MTCPRRGGKRGGKGDSSSPSSRPCCGVGEKKKGRGGKGKEGRKGGGRKKYSLWGAEKKGEEEKREGGRGVSLLSILASSAEPGKRRKGEKEGERNLFRIRSLLIKTKR